MSRLIDADALIRKLEPIIEAENQIYGRGSWGFAVKCRNEVDKSPTIEPERKTGKWIERNPQNSDKCRLIECDQCGFSHIVGFNVPYEHWIENRNFCE